MTRDTETLFYNIRMIIDTKVETEKRAWLISKVNRISPNGIARITLTQDIYDQHRDYIERDSNGNIIGMWANYFNSIVEPVSIPIDDDQPSSITSKITCSGKPQIKIGGSSKTFTVTYYDNENQEMTDHAVGSWALSINGERVNNNLVEFSDVTNATNKIKIKFLGDDSYIGKILTVTNTYNGDITSSLDVDILPL